MTSKPFRRVQAATVPLTRSNRQGNVCQRSTAVESQILSCLALADDEIIGRAPITDKDADGYLQEETLVYLIRESDQERNPVLFEVLSEVLVTRLQGQLSFRFRALEPNAREDAYGQAMAALFERILSPDGSGDFLQVRFWMALNTLAIDIFRASYQQMGEDRAILHPDEPLSSSDDDEDTAEGWEIIAGADGNTPYDIQRFNEAIGEVAAGGLECMPEPIRAAFILRHMEGWPIESSDADELTLSKHFEKTPRTIRNWLGQADRQLRDWRGERHE